MEIRKLQQTGGTSLTVTLPKKWTDGCSLKDKDAVTMVSTTIYSLTIQPINAKRPTSYSSLFIDRLPDPMLIRELIAHYISGVDEIHIKSKKISPEQRAKIRKLCTLFIGFELLDESSENIIIKNVFDPTKFPLSKTIEKMFGMTMSMLEDAYYALANKDETLAKDVISRDFEIDKLHIGITRQLYACIRKDIDQDEYGLTEIDMYFYQNVATQLERIADHTVKIAKTVGLADIEGTPISTSYHVIKYILLLLQQTKQMVKEINNKLAHSILDSNEEIEKQIYSKKTKKHKPSLAWDVLEDSLDRIRGYLMNMAELTIDQAVLKQ